jgi:hypothetical protein
MIDDNKVMYKVMNEMDEFPFLGNGEFRAGVGVADGSGKISSKLQKERGGVNGGHSQERGVRGGGSGGSAAGWGAPPSASTHNPYDDNIAKNSSSSREEFSTEQSSELDSSFVEVRTKDGGVYTAHALVVATPLKSYASLCFNPPLHECVEKAGEKVTPY